MNSIDNSTSQSMEQHIFETIPCELQKSLTGYLTVGDLDR